MRNTIHVPKAGALYFALVFGAGFALGTVRVLWAVPRLGTRMAELLETPIMLVVTMLAARWVVRRMTPKATGFARLSVGLIGLVLMLFAEFMLELRLRGLSPENYVASRDPISGSVYFVMLGVFAMMPLLVARGRDGQDKK